MTKQHKKGIFQKTFFDNHKDKNTIYSLKVLSRNLHNRKAKAIRVPAFILDYRTPMVLINNTLQFIHFIHDVIGLLHIMSIMGIRINKLLSLLTQEQIRIPGYSNYDNIDQTPNSADFSNEPYSIEGELMDTIELWDANDADIIALVDEGLDFEDEDEDIVYDGFESSSFVGYERENLPVNQRKYYMYYWFNKTHKFRFSPAGCGLFVRKRILQESEPVRKVYHRILRKDERILLRYLYWLRSAPPPLKNKMSYYLYTPPSSHFVDKVLTRLKSKTLLEEYVNMSERITFFGEKKPPYAKKFRYKLANLSLAEKILHISKRRIQYKYFMDNFLTKDQLTNYIRLNILPSALKLFHPKRKLFEYINPRVSLSFLERRFHMVNFLDTALYTFFKDTYQYIIHQQLILERFIYAVKRRQLRYKVKYLLKNNFFFKVCFGYLKEHYQFHMRFKKRISLQKWAKNQIKEMINKQRRLKLSKFKRRILLIKSVIKSTVKYAIKFTVNFALIFDKFSKKFMRNIAFRPISIGERINEFIERFLDLFE